jgi:hypothetical protein
MRIFDGGGALIRMHMPVPLLTFGIANNAFGIA